MRVVKGRERDGWRGRGGEGRGGSRRAVQAETVRASFSLTAHSSFATKGSFWESHEATLAKSRANPLHVSCTLFRVSNEQRDAMEAMLASGLRAFLAHSASSQLVGPVESTSPGIPREEDYGLSQFFTRGNTHVVFVDGDHFGMLNPPHVGALQQHIATHLQNLAQIPQSEPTSPKRAPRHMVTEV